MSAAWYDPERISEGFIIEMLAEQRAALYWFTYDDEGRQNWYLGLGQVRGNRLVFPQLLQTSGGRFAPGDNAPELVEKWSARPASFFPVAIRAYGVADRQPQRPPGTQTA